MRGVRRFSRGGLANARTDSPQRGGFPPLRPPVTSKVSWGPEGGAAPSGGNSSRPATSRWGSGDRYRSVSNRRRGEESRRVRRRSHARVGGGVEVEEETALSPRPRGVDRSFFKGGRIVVAGASDDWWIGFAVEADGGVVVRTYDSEDASGTKLPFDPRDALSSSTTSPEPVGVDGTWTIVVEGLDIADDEEEDEEEDEVTIRSRVEVSRGFVVDVLAHAETTRGRTDVSRLARRVAILIDGGEGGVSASGGSSEPPRKTTSESFRSFTGAEAT